MIVSSVGEISLISNFLKFQHLWGFAHIVRIHKRYLRCREETSILCLHTHTQCLAQSYLSCLMHSFIRECSRTRYNTYRSTQTTVIKVHLALQQAGENFLSYNLNLAPYITRQNHTESLAISFYTGPSLTTIYFPYINMEYDIIWLWLSLFKLKLSIIIMLEFTNE